MPFIRKVRVLFKTRLIFPRINGHIERVQIDAIKFERTEIHFSTDVFTAVIVVLAEVPISQFVQLIKIGIDLSTDKAVNLLTIELQLIVEGSNNYHFLKKSF